MKKSWRKIFLKYFDFNESGEIEWWEWLIPFVIIFTMEVIAELVANFIINVF